MIMSLNYCKTHSRPYRPTPSGKEMGGDRKGGEERACKGKGEKWERNGRRWRHGKGAGKEKGGKA